MYYEDTIELDGMSFAVYLERDDYASPPWEEFDCYGPVSGWTSRDKRPGELVLNEDRGSRRYYDYQEACRIARRDRWGGFQGTRRQIAAAAARSDFERLRAWCRDDWYFAVLQVKLLDDYGDIIAESNYIGSVESDGWRYCAEELARELIADLQEMAA
jgi:hypothetical protein